MQTKPSPRTPGTFTGVDLNLATMLATPPNSRSSGSSGSSNHGRGSATPQSTGASSSSTTTSSSSSSGSKKRGFDEAAFKEADRGRYQEAHVSRYGRHSSLAFSTLAGASDGKERTEVTLTLTLTTLIRAHSTLTD